MAKNIIPKGMYDAGIPRGGTARFIIPKKYTKLEFIATGSYSSVCRAICKEENESVVIKKLQTPFIISQHAERTLREISYLNHLIEGEVIVELKQVFSDLVDECFTNIYIVTEDCAHTLAKILRQTGVVTLDRLKYIAYQIVTGLKYIHTAGIVHRDLKPANICVSTDLTTKIIDFGMARSVYSNADQVTTRNALMDITRYPTEYVQTRSYSMYRAPELVLNHVKKYGYSIDMFSYGLILMEMVTATPVFTSINRLSHIYELTKLIGPLPYYSKLSQNEKDFFENMSVKFEGLSWNLKKGKSRVAEETKDAFLCYLRLTKYREDQITENLDKEQADFLKIIENVLTFKLKRPTADEIMRYGFFKRYYSSLSEDDPIDEELQPIEHNESTEYYKARIRQYITVY